MQHAPDSVQHATDDMQHATDSVQHATDDMQHATDSVQHATDDMQHATDSVQHATDDMQHATDSVQHATDDMQHATDSVHRAVRDGQRASGKRTSARGTCAGGRGLAAIADGRVPTSSISSVAGSILSTRSASHGKQYLPVSTQSTPCEYSEHRM